MPIRHLPPTPAHSPPLQLPCTAGVSKSYTLEAGAGGQQVLQTDGINVRGVWPCQVGSRSQHALRLWYDWLLSVPGSSPSACSAGMNSPMRE